MNNITRLTFITAFPLLLLSGCAQTQNSAQRHANHFVMATADDASGPNFRMNTADSARMATPFFEQFWQQGKKDRASGVSLEEAQKRTGYFHSDEFINAIRGKSRFAGADYNPDKSISPRWRKEMAEAVSATYMDGYQGID